MKYYDWKTVSHRYAYPMSPRVQTCVSLACQLDRWADAELQQGHYRAAEQFARKAAEMREAAQ